MRYARLVIDPRLRLDLFTLLLVALGLLGAALVLLRVSHGVVVGSIDGRYYIQLARALSEGLPGLDWLFEQTPNNYSAYVPDYARMASVPASHLSGTRPTYDS